MKVKTIMFGRLVSSPGCNNRKAEATIEVEEGDNESEVIARAKALVNEALEEPVIVQAPQRDYDWDEDYDPEENEEDGEDEEQVVLPDEADDGQETVTVTAAQSSLFDQKAADEAQQEEDLLLKPDATPKEALGTRRLTFYCAACGASFAQLQELHSHISLVHDKALRNGGVDIGDKV